MPRAIISVGFQAYYIVNRFLTSLRDKYRTNYFCNLSSLSCWGHKTRMVAVALKSFQSSMRHLLSMLPPGFHKLGHIQLVIDGPEVGHRFNCTCMIFGAENDTKDCHLAVFSFDRG